METITTQKSLDRRGRTITTFVVFDAATELQAMNNAEVLELITDEFEPFEQDIPAWCQATGHVLVFSEKIHLARIRSRQNAIAGAKGNRFSATSPGPTQIDEGPDP